ncbi:proline/glycine betaine ABC transporter ATP-binding protein ProV [Oceanidesulfovibrio indonesiensis]|uniref:Proline/glycine betaine ABC transporter ATP-binding protein ProV n=1 Tax=Oceanidesulfovibrio indonesiensis TaxID=54767 RepID=A0A7M3MI89_9BACT|nr:glycine betaine/L-proline ABC transporter ATP-binding protein ProV [Oceanidesulfovibrio indonesiensis]TVM19408.1 proline/glycine betaine ABC transporter ATP-binding protein ProV [Oceanidesulfovibrio indonesiensis]
MNEKIVVKNLYKIFGKDPGKALELLKQGYDKESIHEKTGMTVGVQDASFSVMEGEVFVVMGLSGSGKSTLVRMLNRLIDPSAGYVYVDGEDVAHMNQEALVNLRRRNMTMVFQSFALMPHMTVLENVAFGLEMAGVPREERETRASEALEQVGLGPYGSSYPRELSGGMQQRVGLARGLAVDPEIMLMDEAFSALDPLIRTEMQDELLNLQQEHKRTIVFISHDLDEAMRIGDRIAIMEGGRIVQVGTPEEILRNPADEYVRSFFRGVDPTNILTAGDIVRDTQTTVISRDGLGPRAALERLTSQDRTWAFVLDPKKRYLGAVSVESLREAVGNEESGESGLKSALLDEVAPVSPSATMQDILVEVASKPWPVPVVNENGAYMGAISKNIFLRTLQREAEQAQAEG